MSLTVGGGVLSSTFGSAFFLLRLFFLGYDSTHNVCIGVFTVKIYINAMGNVIGVWMSMIVCVVLHSLFFLD